MNEPEIRKLLQAILRGEIDVDAAVERLRELPFEDAGIALIDHHRPLRHGASEVIFGEGKTGDQVAAIVGRMAAKEQNVLVTRLDPAKAETVGRACPEGEYDPEARTFTWIRTPPEPRTQGKVLVVSAGTSDLPVAREAIQALRFFGHEPAEVVDAGVAGLHRILAHADLLKTAELVIVVAGMEGALPSVVGGLVAVPVIAVPTSVGYGASFGGIAALLGMLNSCSAGVTVVNIDNGFGAAAAAHRYLLSR